MSPLMGRNASAPGGLVGRGMAPEDAAWTNRANWTPRTTQVTAKMAWTARRTRKLRSARRPVRPESQEARESRVRERAMEGIWTALGPA
jgi:hypothetical protein